MLRNIQAKIIIAFTLLGILVITLLGLFFIDRLEKIDEKVNNPNIESVEISNNIKTEIVTTRNLVYNSLIVFSIVSIIFSFLIAKLVISPISKIIKSAEKVSNGKSMDIKYLGDGRKKTEIDEGGNFIHVRGEARREALQDAADGRSVGFAPGSYGKYFAKCARHATKYR